MQLKVLLLTSQVQTTYARANSNLSEHNQLPFPFAMSDEKEKNAIAAVLFDLSIRRQQPFVDPGAKSVVIQNDTLIASLTRPTGPEDKGMTDPRHCITGVNDKMSWSNSSNTETLSIGSNVTSETQPAISKYASQSDPPIIQSIKLPKTFINHSYRDYSRVPPPVGYVCKTNIDEMTFVEKIHHILSQKEFESIVRWMPHGRAFIVVVPKLLEQHILPKYFGHRRYSSLLRQLSNHGMKLITQGIDRNCQYHELLLRGMPHLCLKFPKPKDARRLVPDPKNEPDFYKISERYPVTNLTNNIDITETLSSSDNTLPEPSNNRRGFNVMNSSEESVGTMSLPSLKREQACSLFQATAGNGGKRRCVSSSISGRDELLSTARTTQLTDLPTQLVTSELPFSSAGAGGPFDFGGNGSVVNELRSSMLTFLDGRQSALPNPSPVNQLLNHFISPDQSAPKYSLPSASLNFHAKETSTSSDNRVLLENYVLAMKCQEANQLNQMLNATDYQINKLLLRKLNHQEQNNGFL